MSDNRQILPELVVTDIDGVWTDGGMYYGQDGEELKKFHTYDSAGILFCQMLNIPTAIITGEHTQIVENRANKLKVTYLYQGVKNKLATLEMLCNELGISLSEVAYIGDDLNDIKVLKAVGYSYAPQNAPRYIKSVVSKVTTKAGGEGAFREMVEDIIGEKNIDKIIDDLLQ
ncbi:MAG: HAD-IIIA family hydrolase [Rikenellaceae bacterium]